MATTKQELITNIELRDFLKSDAVKRAFLEIDRADFVPNKYLHEAYEDYPVPLEYQNGAPTSSTVSQPSTVVFMLELLSVQPGEKVLDVGSGSGFTTALLAHMASEHGIVLGMEIIPELVDFGRGNLRKYFQPPRADITRAKYGIYGTPGEVYDKILVSAAAISIQQDLISQLKVGGVLVMPIMNSIVKMTRRDESQHVKMEEYPGFSFVPLV